MRLIHSIVFAFLVASSSVLSQDAQNSQPFIAEEAEVTWLDQLAAARDLVFDPSRISSYWPEYLYKFEQIAGSQVCQGNHGNSVLGIDIHRVLGINLGVVALVWASPPSAPTDTATQDWAGSYSGYNISDVIDFKLYGSYAGTISTETTDSNFHLSSSNSNSLTVEELCKLVSQENFLDSASALHRQIISADDPTANLPLSWSEARIVTSEVFPDTSVAYERHVRLRAVN